MNYQNFLEQQELLLSLFKSGISQLGGRMKQKLILALLSLTLGFVARGAEPCVQVYYDSAPQHAGVYDYGKLHATYLQNLLGHFPRYQQYLIPIEAYQQGQLDRCKASFYVGTYYDNAIPPSFITDFQSTRKAVVWAGYNIWKIPNVQLARLWDVNYKGLSKLDWENRDSKGVPGFFKFHDYKGETFIKFGGVSGPDQKTFNGAYEITLFETLAGAEANTRVWARHSTQGTKTPYILEKDKKWVIGDSPFSYVSLEDRYLIMADILFDVLQEEPVHKGKRPALVRFEDIHPQLPLWQVEGLIRAAENRGVPFSFSLIPSFRDPYQVLAKNAEDMEIDLGERPEFDNLIREAVDKRKGSIIFHGATHQFKDLKNPVGVSGIDFEFWDTNRNLPLQEDSAQMVLDRLEPTYALMQDQDLRPSAWLTPHYAGSPLNNTMFGQLFLWSVGRAIYYPHQVRQRRKLPIMLSLDLFGKTANGYRRGYFQDLEIEFRGNYNPGGQFFPYEILGDVFGQRIIPENVGFIRPESNPHTPKIMGVDDMIQIMKRNRVIRDAWASMFVHPFLVASKASGGIGEFQGDTAEIERLFQAALDLDYEFIDLKQWTRKALRPKRSPTIEVHLGRSPSPPPMTLGSLFELWLKNRLDTVGAVKSMESAAPFEAIGASGMDSIQMKLKHTL